MCCYSHVNAQVAHLPLPPNADEIHEVIFEVDEYVHAHPEMWPELDEEAHADNDHSADDARMAAVAQDSDLDTVYISISN